MCKRIDPIDELLHSKARAQPDQSMSNPFVLYIEFILPISTDFVPSNHRSTYLPIFEKRMYKLIEGTVFESYDIVNIYIFM